MKTYFGTTTSFFPHLCKASMRNGSRVVKIMKYSHALADNRVQSVMPLFENGCAMILPSRPPLMSLFCLTQVTGSPSRSVSLQLTVLVDQIFDFIMPRHSARPVNEGMSEAAIKHAERDNTMTLLKVCLLSLSVSVSRFVGPFDLKNFLMCLYVRVSVHTDTHNPIFYFHTLWHSVTHSLTQHRCGA